MSEIISAEEYFNRHEDQRLAFQELLDINRTDLNGLVDAYRDGRVVVLPDCKINDNVFVKVGNGSEVSEIAVDCFYVDESGAYIGHFDIDGQLMRWKNFTKC